MRVLLLGAGLVGGNAAAQIMRERPELDLRIGDLYLESAQRVAKSISDKVEAVQVDVHNSQSLDAACADVDIIANFAGPFFRNARPIMEAAIRNKIDYIDINDDDDVALEILFDKDLRARAEASGVRIIMGSGMAPGLSNVLSRQMIEQLDVAKSVFINIVMPLHIVSYFTPAVLDHMFAVSSREVMKYADGQFVKTLGYEQEHHLSALPPFQNLKVFNIGHGEVPMLGRAFPDLEEVGTRIGYIEEGANDKWRTLASLGLGSGEPLPGLDQSPVRVLAAMMADGRLNEFLGTDATGFDAGHIYEVVGVKDGREVALRSQVHVGAYSEDDDDSAATGARVGVELLLDDQVTGVGVLTPEVCFEPNSFIDRFMRTSPALTLTQETRVLGEYPIPVP